MGLGRDGRPDAHSLGWVCGSITGRKGKRGMAGQLEGQVAIVTGAGRGIGLAIAARYAREGARVVIDDVDDEAGQTAATALAERGGQVQYIHADVSRNDEVAALVAATEHAFGPVDILVNNALPASRHVAGNDWDP